MHGEHAGATCSRLEELRSPVNCAQSRLSTSHLIASGTLQPLPCATAASKHGRGLLHLHLAPHAGPFAAEDPHKAAAAAGKEMRSPAASICRRRCSGGTDGRAPCGQSIPAASDVSSFWTFPSPLQARCATAEPGASSSAVAPQQGAVTALPRRSALAAALAAAAGAWLPSGAALAVSSVVHSASSSDVQQHACCKQRGAAEQLLLLFATHGQLAVPAARSAPPCLMQDNEAVKAGLNKYVKVIS